MGLRMGQAGQRRVGKQAKDGSCIALWATTRPMGWPQPAPTLQGQGALAPIHDEPPTRHILDRAQWIRGCDRDLEKLHWRRMTRVHGGDEWVAHGRGTAAGCGWKRLHVGAVRELEIWAPAAINLGSSSVGCFGSCSSVRAVSPRCVWKGSPTQTGLRWRAFIA